MKMSMWRCVREICVLLHLTACVAGMTGRCSLFGRHHVHTFDGVLYEFPGDCSYLLAGDCSHRAFTLLGDFVNGRRTGVTLYLGDAFELHLSVNGQLTQGDQRLSLPYASHAVFVGSELGFYKLWSEEFGFTITIDNSANIALTLTKHHRNRTCGLCGNFNSVPADEYTAQEGFLTENSYDFANSWVVKGAEQSCQRISKPSQTCNDTKQTPEIMSSCSMLQTSSVFLHCAHVVAPEAFLLLCQEEACHCDRKGGEDCYCPILLEYARTCHAHGILLQGWQEESQCFPKCPIGMQYSECTKSCSTTCHSLNIQEVCKEECVDGCTCPVGKVLDGNRCVEVSQCSCVHMGRHFPPGSTISQDCNTCVCRDGSWECTNEGCPGECLVVGQSHFKTFDNKFFTFTGHCQYLLARDCTDSGFSVVIENVQCADDQDAVCTRSVTLNLPTLEDMTVKLKHGGVVSVNSMDIQTPLHHGRLHIQRSVQASVRVKFGDDLRLDWDGRGRVLLKLGPRWAGQTCGLCGNFNGNQGDDFLSGSGLVEAGPQAFGQSWRINGNCESMSRHERDACASNPKRVHFAEEACATIMSDVFTPCHFLVNPAHFQRFCRYDVCACEDGAECLCSALSAYAAACAAKGVLLNWRSPSLCALECPEGQVYEACGSLCDRTCRALSGAEADCDSERLCEEGCFCPTGKYLSDTGECVTADECTCLHNGQLYQPSDVYADQNSICYCENGFMRCTSSETSNLLSDLFYDDDLAPSRDRRSAQCPPPLMRTECNAGEKGLECARTCQNLDLPCVSLACIPGCLCPPGTVRHRRDCIAPERCPCYHNNRPYASGQTISVDCNTCVCENRRWRCTEKLCDGVCHTLGEGHYITFDGFKYSFPGLCQYVLVQDMCNGEEGSFRVLVENEACGIVGHRCAKAITVFYHGGLIVLQHGEVKMKRPVLQGSQVEIVRSGQFYTLLLGKHISLSWDQGTRVMVHISASYRGRVCGLCGNFDGNVNNDLISSNNQLEVDPPHFGNSWKVVPSCADVTQIPAPCSDNIVKLVTVEQSCRVITGPLFRECNSEVDAEPYVDMCVEAACSCSSVGDCACFCDVIAAYAQVCSQSGVSVTWRSNDLCPMSCEELNPRNPSTGEELCQWRYNACGPACPITCQHPDPLQCSLTCVEGCHPSCPPGQLLDEVALRCVAPSQCQVCIHEGQRISHGNKVILNHNNPEFCKICHCDNNTLTCDPCTSLNDITTPAPTPSYATFTTLPFTTLMPEGTCDRAMDLAFLLDGSAALSKEEFQETKEFILGVIERFRMGSAHTRATVLLYHSGVKTYDLQVQKWLFKKTVRELHYTGGDAAFLDEAVKYLVINIYDKNKRPNAGRVAIILTASSNPRPVRSIVKMLRKKSITTLTVVLSPGVNMGQINDITKTSPENRAYVLSSTAELSDRLLDLTDYLCTLGMEPEVPNTQPTVGKARQTTTTTAQIPPLGPNPTLHITSTPTPATPSTASPFTTSPSSSPPVKDVTFILEGSDSVGDVNFNKSLIFLNEVVSQLAEKEEVIRITVIQYSVTVTVEISRWEVRRQKTLLLDRLRQIRWRGGSKTNTGLAVTTTLEETIVTQPSQGPTPPQLVFLVTENPPTDTVTRPPSSTSHTQVYPIGVGTKVRETDLLPFSFPRRPVIVDDYNRLTTLVPHVVNITRTAVWPRSPTITPLVSPTLSSLPPSVPCKKPVDVLFLLKAGNQCEDMKTFIQAFIKNADIGLNSTQVSVVQYGVTNKAEFTWKVEQSKSHLLDLVESIESGTSAAPALGSALRFAVQLSISSVSGGRLGVAKAVVMLVTDKSADDVTEAVNEALAAGVSVFPIGVGPHYDRNELGVLGRHGNQDNTLHLNSMDQLRMLLTLDHGFTERICRAGPPGVCVDDNGNERKPGESWLLEDGCHSLLCHPSGAVTVQNHKVSCDRLEPPACRNNIPPLRVQETCGCHWECPCMCMGSSTNHVVRFDGLALRLDGEGRCSYTLLTVSRGTNKGSEVKLHSGPCQNPESYNQVCMKVMEVIHGSHTLLLKDDMTAVIDDEELALPWRYNGLELVRYGGVMLQLKSDHGYVLTFTPQSNEFTITLPSSSTTSHTAGLCGACGEEQVNVLSLRNGNTTTDQAAFTSDWTVAVDGSVCLPKRKLVCSSAVTMGCQALRLEAFERCHAHIPVQVFLSKCEEQACEESDVCELIAAYARLCRQRGICVNWRSPHLCPLSCPSSMEYDACRTGCVEDCGSIQTLRGDFSVARGNNSSCMDTPTEGCFCTGGTILHNGQCVFPEACRQCVDHHGHKYRYMQSWVPDESPCLICMCLDQQRINCTARPCNDVRPPVCGPCEILKEDRESKCCPQYKCVCDRVNCELPEAPRCEDGQTAVLKNPGECQPVHECVCKKEECTLQAPPACPVHRQLSVTKTKCCDVFECVCSCTNSTRTCPLGFITSSSTNDCSCTETTCLPDKVCVVGGVVHPVGSEWVEGCEKCSCTLLQDKETDLHIAQCTPPVCDRTCPRGSTYTPSKGQCCGKCTPTSCVESKGEMRGDMLIGGNLRHVGEVWQSPHDKCVLHECVRVKDEVFISAANVSCSAVDTPSCPLGSELRCDIIDCCPHCHCAPMDVCVLNNTVIGAGERLMVDVCTHCVCTVEDGAVRKHRVSCRRISCPTCPMGYSLQKEEDACCGHCVATACFISKPNGEVMSVQVNSTHEEGCNLYTCGVNSKGDLVLQTRVTTCPPFNRQTCLDEGGKVSHIGTTCCEMCTEPPCRKTVGTLNYIRVDDCQSENQIEMHYCEGKCHSKSMYSLERAAVEQECVCCSAVETEPLSVPVLCANGTRSHHTVLSVSACDCLSKHCT
ncbi:von Willebrand factor [Solea senegalensis]|uniref:von Willebrand factor n=2 Tax=Solea senegalensis TaxID=28829 RepID=A0AAV6SX77_SOLSE|nr:von Willebrand factor isoform X1 [Solea senegalensis]KAG7521790.1 von Willebrand factor [Solea senegalensis]